MPSNAIGSGSSPVCTFTRLYQRDVPPGCAYHVISQMFPTAATARAVDKIFRAHIGHVPIRKRIIDAPAKAKGTFSQMGRAATGATDARQPMILLACGEDLQPAANQTQA